MMAPFGETVLAWRLFRAMTQEQLARQAGLSRPNLSAIERGEREVTLRTLRALALALDVRPGVLADGETPGLRSTPLSRDGMERIATAAVRGGTPTDARESDLVKHLRAATTARRRLATKRANLSRRADRSYFALRTSEPPEVLASLVDRVGVALDRSGRK